MYLILNWTLKKYVCRGIRNHPNGVHISKSGKHNCLTAQRSREITRPSGSEWLRTGRRGDVPAVALVSSREHVETNKKNNIAAGPSAHIFSHIPPFVDLNEDNWTCYTHLPTSQFNSYRHVCTKTYHI